MKKEYTLSLEKTNLIALTLIAPMALIEGLPYILIYGWQSVKLFKWELATGFSVLLFVLLVVLVGILMHEFLHGFTWSLFTKRKWKAISFGVKWEYLTPYCHCDEALKKFQFILGAIMPLLIMGVVPVVISFFTGNFRIWFFGFFFTLTAGGDIIAIWMLRKIPRKYLIQDHPSEMGFVLVEKDCEYQNISE